MTLYNIIMLSIGGTVLFLGLILLLVALKKKKSIWNKIFMGIAAVIGLTACIVTAVNILNVYRLNNQQNYAACELMELERYDAGRDMAETANSRLKNPISAELITVSLGLNGDRGVCAQVAQSFLGEYRGNNILTRLKDLSLAPAQPESDEYQVELLRILREIKKTIKPSDKAAAQNLAKAMDLLESGDSSDELQLSMGRLKENDVLTMQLQAKVAAAQYDYKQAFALLEQVAKKDNILPNRVALASAAAKGAGLRPDAEISRQQQQIRDLTQESYEVSQQLDEETRPNIIERLERRLRELRKKIEELTEDLISLPARKAANYLRSLWLRRSWFDRNSTEYLLSMSELCLISGDDLKAEEYAEEFFARDLTRVNDRLTVDIWRFMINYKDIYTDEDISQFTLQEILDKLHQGVWFSKWYGAEHGSREVDFTGFLDGVLQRIRNSVHISGVRTTNMQDFMISVNISRENMKGVSYTKSDFTLYDMGIEVKDFEVTINQGEDTSVCMVVDYSGSMNGERLAAAKNAVAGFIHSASSNVKVGLVAFDDSAQVYSPVTESIGPIARSVMNLSGGGGTNISGGLIAGMQTLERQTGNKIIVLLSDGEDGNKGQMEEVLAQLRAKSIVVYAVGMGEADSSYMQNIANKTGGKFLAASSADQLALLYQTINRFISNDYTFTFRTVSNSPAYVRTVKIVMKDGFSDEVTYTIGPDADEVQAAIDAAPLADFFEQIGGSNKNAGGDEQ